MPTFVESAKSSSLYDLVKHVKESVKSKHGVDLEEEIILLENLLDSKLHRN